jgi:hypothetical protein
MKMVKITKGKPLWIGDYVIYKSVSQDNASGKIKRILPKGYVQIDNNEIINRNSILELNENKYRYKNSFVELNESI